MKPPRTFGQARLGNGGVCGLTSADVLGEHGGAWGEGFDEVREI